MSENHLANAAQQAFITESNLKYYNKYDYSLVKYINDYTPVIVICPEHGELVLLPTRHRRGVDGCRKCCQLEITQRPFTNDFVQQATLKHGDKYNYSKTVYIDEDTPVCIISSAGEFSQTPKIHLLDGDSDPFIEYKQCDYLLFKNAEKTSNFVQKATLKHGDKYRYSATVYYGMDSRVDITCVKHGCLYQTPEQHLSSLNVCDTCIEQQEQLRDYLLAQNNPQKKKIDQLNLFVLVCVHRASKTGILRKIHYTDAEEFLTAMRKMKNAYITVRNYSLLSLPGVLDQDDNTRFKQLTDSLDINPLYIAAQLEFISVYNHYKNTIRDTSNSVVKEIIRLFDIKDFHNIRQSDLITAILQDFCNF